MYHQKLKSCPGNLLRTLKDLTSLVNVTATYASKLHTADLSNVQARIPDGDMIGLGYWSG